ncbi:RagB/SusD family nutrient uptake outer membrane protein [Parabacteroides bouchesdurhonensis]|uniref:RagB/SusD family nutrient uptake outer membrane protein n=1 Tax=Parabacteroides bouchesdurhonensis TaxID=1936995 RepID=UPI000E47BE1D|nr:RagB/SusD family nutrient uptake outer membrane protein [Parabacteroides bouchesdurhonensis]RHJ93554.1 RagB/SusD family nutrient uptake outer membrane protein [Bacteroides sp. AM07-16]
MKKLVLYIFGLTLIGLSTISCSDFLDRTDTNDSYTSNGFFNNETSIKEGVTGIYANMYMNLAYNVPHVITLEHFTPLALERNENTTIGAGGGLNPDNASVQDFWTFLYRNIARANELISGAKAYEETLNAKSFQYLAEAHVLRAFCYYYLIGLWGDVPFFDSPVTTEQYTTALRTSKVEILDFIINDINQVAEQLPWTAEDRGRVDRAFAYGVIARAGLLGGGLNYGGKSSEYFRAAANAASKVIGQRGLAHNFEDMWTIAGQAKSDVRNEFLFELPYSTTASVQLINMIAFGQVSRIQGQTGRHPSMMLADTYECIDGKRIDESPLYDPRHPQRNRDPRFGATLWMHGDTCTTNNGSLNSIILEAYELTTKQYNYATNTWDERNNDDMNSAAAWASFCNAGVGYIWAKYSKETDENIGSASCNVPIMRYAEILLSYAEAKIELNELDQSVYDAINQVRNRAGMPDVSADRIGNQDKMRQLVRRERKVEFALEGLHLFDMRRWGIGDIENDKPSYGLPLPTVRYEGMSATDIPNFKTSARHDLNDIPNYDAYKSKLKVRDVNRYWEKKFELWPIPQQERNRNPNIAQNEGY